MAQVAISTVTEGELLYGVALRPDATRRAGLEREGLPMGNLDIMIGAHALALGAVLVTSDKAFTRIARLKIEDWTRP